jgi:hypothetical protein
VAVLLAAIVSAGPGVSALAQGARPPASTAPRPQREPEVTDNCRIGDHGGGSLITPTWVFTAAHVARAFLRDAPETGVVFGRRSVPVKRVILHPAWKDGGPHDVALIELRRPVTFTDPVPLDVARIRARELETRFGTGRYAPVERRIAALAYLDWIEETIGEGSLLPDLSPRTAPAR